MIRSAATLEGRSQADDLAYLIQTHIFRLLDTRLCHDSRHLPYFGFVMDILSAGILLAISLLVAYLIFIKNRHLADGKSLKVSPAGTNISTKTSRQAGLISLDEQTRFIESPKRKQYRLLNDAEQVLYHRLREAMPSMQIFVQVGVAQLAQLRGRREARQLSRMASRGVDFVVCDQEFAIVAAIELAWPTSDAETISPENEKRQALQSLGIPLIVFRPNNLPDAQAISLEIADAIVRRNRLEAARA